MIDIQTQNRNEPEQCSFSTNNPRESCQRVQYTVGQICNLGALGFNSFNCNWRKKILKESFLEIHKRSQVRIPSKAIYFPCLKKCLILPTV